MPSTDCEGPFRRLWNNNEWNSLPFSTEENTEGLLKVTAGSDSLLPRSNDDKVPKEDFGTEIIETKRHFRGNDGALELYSSVIGSLENEKWLPEATNEERKKKYGE